VTEAHKAVTPSAGRIHTPASLLSRCFVEESPVIHDPVTAGFSLPSRFLDEIITPDAVVRPRRQAPFIHRRLQQSPPLRHTGRAPLPAGRATVEAVAVGPEALALRLAGFLRLRA
jgi:hypothetical protein